MKERLLNKQFRLSSPKSDNRVITLSEPMDDPEIKSWEIGDFRGEPTLILRGDGTVYCKMRWEKNRLIGRDTRGGYTMLVPIEQPQTDRKPLQKGRPLQETDKRPRRSVAKFQSEVDTLVDSYEKNSNKAIAVIACNRPQYLQQVIAGLKKSDLSGHDVYLFLDKPKDQREEKLQQVQVEMGLTDRVVKLPVNFGCGRTLIDVRRQMFDRKGYDSSFIFEDDMVPATNYIQFCENLLKWGQDNYTNVGAVQGWTKCLLPPEEKRKRIRQVHATYTNWWGYLTTKWAWDQVKDFIYGYKDTFLFGDYSVRPVVPILKYFKAASQREFQLREGGFQPSQNDLAHRRRLFDSIPSGQDGATWLAYDKANLVRLAPVVNRGLYIGKEGIHSTSAAYHRDRFHRMTLETIPQDKKLKNFEVAGNASKKNQ